MPGSLHCTDPSHFFHSTVFRLQKHTDGYREYDAACGLLDADPLHISTDCIYRLFRITLLDLLAFSYCRRCGSYNVKAFVEQATCVSANRPHPDTSHGQAQGLST